VQKGGRKGQKRILPPRWTGEPSSRLAREVGKTVVVISGREKWEKRPKEKRGNSKRVSLGKKLKPLLITVLSRNLGKKTMLILSSSVKGILRKRGKERKGLHLLLFPGCGKNGESGGSNDRELSRHLPLPKGTNLLVNRTLF